MKADTGLNRIGYAVLEDVHTIHDEEKNIKTDEKYGGFDNEL